MIIFGVGNTILNYLSPEANYEVLNLGPSCEAQFMTNEYFLMVSAGDQPESNSLLVCKVCAL